MSPMSPKLNVTDAFINLPISLTMVFLKITVDLFTLNSLNLFS